MNVSKSFYHHTVIEKVLVIAFWIGFLFIYLYMGWVVLLFPGIFVIPGFIFLGIKYFLSRTKLTVDDNYLYIHQREGVFSDKFKIPLKNIKSVHEYNSVVVSGEKSSGPGGAIAKLVMGSGSRTESKADRIAIHTFKRVYQLSPRLEKSKIEQIKSFLESTVQLHG